MNTYSCPCCGVPCIVAHSDDGTNYYIPQVVMLEDYQLLRDELTITKEDLKYWRSTAKAFREEHDALWKTVPACDPDLAREILTDGLRVEEAV